MKPKASLPPDLVGHDPELAQDLAELREGSADGEDPLFVDLSSQIRSREELRAASSRPPPLPRRPAEHLRTPPVYHPPHSPPAAADAQTLSLQTIQVAPADEYCPMDDEESTRVLGGSPRARRTAASQRVWLAVIALAVVVLALAAYWATR